MATLTLTGYIYASSGVVANLPALPVGAIAFSTDTHHLYVGSGAGNIDIGPSGGGGLTIGAAISGGTNQRIIFDDLDVVGESAGLTFNKTGSKLVVGGTITAGNDLTVQHNGTVNIVIGNADSAANNQNWGFSSVTDGPIIFGTFNDSGVLSHGIWKCTRSGLQTTAIIFNQEFEDVDFQVKGDNDQNLLYIDASTDRIGIGTATPGTKLEVAGVAAVKQGTSSSVAKVGGVIFDHYADGGSTHTDGTEDDLYSDTTPANCLGTDGDKLEAQYAAVVVGSATATRRIQAYFGGTKVLDSGTNTFASGGNADIWITVIRETSTVVRVCAEFVPSGITLQPVVTYTRITGLTLSGTNVLKLTGIAAGTGAAASDIVAKLGRVTWLPAA